ncbi:MAG: carboxymuconolactone decarboxylase family protein [Polyangiaceae bacterium]
MSDFPLYTMETAPQESKPILGELQKAFGFLPNIAGKMAISPEMMTGFIGLFQNVHAGTFSEVEVQVLLLTDAVTNACTWAVAFHSFLGLKEGLSEDDVKAMRAGGVPKDPKLAALSMLARKMIEKRGHVEESVVDEFLAAGYEKRHVVEAIEAVAASTITNYVCTITQPPLEEPFKAHAWKDLTAVG